MFPTICNPKKTFRIAKIERKPPLWAGVVDITNQRHNNNNNAQISVIRWRGMALPSRSSIGKRPGGNPRRQLNQSLTTQNNIQKKD